MTLCIIPPRMNSPFKKILYLSLLLAMMPRVSLAQQAIDEVDTGAWYMYFFAKSFEESQWGLQGDVQYRNRDLGGDLEQLLLRGGLTWTTKNKVVTLTQGYANITSGAFGDSDATSNEHRIYQEALIRHGLGERLRFRHRLRTEQRWVEDQDFRTRFRYALFMDIPLNNTRIDPGTWYLAIYNEIFLNLEKNIGNGRRVKTFDRNRLYAALGYSLSKNLKIQGGYMHQATSTVDKGQIQVSLHHTF